MFPALFQELVFTSLLPMAVFVFPIAPVDDVALFPLVVLPLVLPAPLPVPVAPRVLPDEPEEPALLPLDPMDPPVLDAPLLPLDPLPPAPLPAPPAAYAVAVTPPTTISEAATVDAILVFIETPFYVLRVG